MANLKEQLARKLSTLEVPAVEPITETEVEIMAKDDNQVIQLRPQADSLPTVIDTTPSFAISLVEAKNRVQLLQQFVAEFMKAGVDYGIVPGTDKPTLLKPGAEKLCEIYGFAKFIDINTQIEDWDLPLFAYIVKVRLVNKRTGLTEAEGVGAANSRERKYIKLDTFSLQNTLLKMAKKRALVDAVLSATRSSGIFTQDIEDMDMPQQTTPSKTPASIGTAKAPFSPTVPATISRPYSPPAASQVHASASPPPMTERQRNMITALVSQKGLDSDAVSVLLVKMFGHSNGSSLSKTNASKFIDVLISK